MYEISYILRHFQSIEGMLRQQEGIVSIKVALLAERGVIEYDPAVWDIPKLINVCPQSIHPQSIKDSYMPTEEK